MIRPEPRRGQESSTADLAASCAGAKLGFMVGQRLILSVVIATLFGLVPLAHITPPDQTWLGGLYDGNDYDEAVIFLTSVVAAVSPDPAPALPRPAVVVGVATQLGPAVVSTLRPAPYHLRAPPLA